MKIQIKDFRAISGSVEFEPSPVALVVGPNESGKTSAAQAVAAALTGATLPDGRPKKAAGGLIHAGADQAVAEVVTDAGSARVVWPDAKAYTEGQPIRCSSYAAGLASLTALTPANRTQVLMDYLDAAPGYDDVVAALGPQYDRDGAVVQEGLPRETIDRAWQAVQERDWDDAASLWRDDARAKKGAWQEVTGAKYGEKQGRDWRPSSWDRSIAQSGRETLEQAVETARRAEVDAQAAAGIEESRRQALEQQSAQIPAIRARMEQAESDGKQAAAQVESIQKELAELPAPDAAPQLCPHCEGQVRVESGKVVPADALSDEERQSRKEAIGAAEQRLADAKAKHQQHRQEWDQANREMQAAQAAADELNRAQEGESGGGGDPEQARQDREQAEARLAAWDAHQRAQQLHQEIRQAERIARVLEPGGVRQQKLAQALAGFNNRLAALCRAADWKTVAVGEDLAISFGAYDMRDLSESALWRVRVILQVALAQLDGSEAVVVDAADILERTDRNGLLFMLRDAWGLPAVVTMTADPDREEPIPDLSQAGMGQTVWLPRPNSTS